MRITGNARRIQVIHKYVEMALASPTLRNEEGPPEQGIQNGHLRTRSNGERVSGPEIFGVCPFKEPVG